MIKRSRCHTSIKTLPLSLFQQAMQYGNLSVLVISGRPSTKMLAGAWRAIMNEYLCAFGIPEDYAKYLDLKTRAAVIWDKVYNHDQRWREVEARLLESQAKQYIGQAEGRIDTALAKVSRFMGFRVNPAKVTVYEFYQYLEEMKTNG